MPKVVKKRKPGMIPVGSKDKRAAQNECLYIGIDPGKEGGLAYVDGEVFNSVVTMPKTERDIWDWFGEVKQIAQDGDYRIFAGIEKVGAMPKQGVKSMFTFGMGYGGLRMALIGSGIAFEEYTPQSWMKEFGMKRKPKETPTAWKKRLMGKAQQLFPQAGTINQKNADAILIAEYTRRKATGRVI